MNKTALPELIILRTQPSFNSETLLITFIVKNWHTEKHNHEDCKDQALIQRSPDESQRDREI